MQIADIFSVLLPQLSFATMQQDITNRDILNQLNSTRTRQSRSGDNRLTSGLSSSSVRDLETMTRSELLDLKAKNERLLENAYALLKESSTSFISGLDQHFFCIIALS